MATEGGTTHFLGDYIDRGKESLAVLKKVKALTEQGAIALTGNHERLFLKWLAEPEWAHYLGNNIGGTATLASLQQPEWNANTPEEIASCIIKYYAELLEWMDALPLFHQWDKYFLYMVALIQKKRMQHKQSHVISYGFAKNSIIHHI